MASWMEYRCKVDSLHRQEKDPSSDAQRRVANGVWVEMSLAAELHVFAQTARTYCRPEIISGKPISKTIRDPPVFRD